MKNGSLRVVGRSALFSLYKPRLATYLKDSSFDQNSAKGFIDLWGMECVTYNNIR
jgi:argininosuccinate synthase